VEIAAANAADSIVVSGNSRDIGVCERDLAAAKIACSRLHVSHAFHSAAMDGALPTLRGAFDHVRLNAPAIPFYSCTTGKLIDAADAMSADYWCRQLRMPVRFADAAQDAMRNPGWIALEIGPGQALSNLLRRNSAWRERVVASLGREKDLAMQQLAAAAGQVWCLGGALDWHRYHAGADRRRVPLPGYPFRGPRYWIDDVSAPASAAAAQPKQAASAQVAERAEDLHAQLREIIGALTGESIAAEHDATRLLDLGLDSLALTQAALEIERRHGLKLKLRRLMEDVDSIDKLAALIERDQPKRERTAAAPSVRVAAGEAEVAASAPAFGAAARITLAADTLLQPPQRRWLDDFIARYTTHTARSKTFNQRHRATMADPRVVTGFNPLWKELVYPLVVTRSDGARLWDIDGREYIDLLNAFGANFFGYQPEFVKRALAEQIEAGFEIGPQHPLTAEVAQLIREMTGVERVAFCNTGSEAVMGAMRIARTVTGRKTIAIFKDSYHGIFDEVIVRGTPQLRSIAAAPGILANAVENVLVLDYGSAAALDVIRARGAELAAVMIEPVQSRNPTLQPREFVHALRKICDAQGCALIFDEVITGFRVSPGGAQEFFGVRADIATYGKIIGGGLPFAAIGGKAQWMDALDGGAWQFGDASRPEAGVTYFAGTFVRHPLALAAAKAALVNLKESGAALQRTLNERTAGLAARLNAFFEQQHAPMRVDWFSSLWRIRIDADQALAELFHYALRERGLHVYAQFGFFLSTAHGDAEVSEIADRIESATLELLDAGILKRRVQAPVAQPDTAIPLEAKLTPAQSERWTACQFDELANVAFNESILLYLHGDLDRRALEASIARVCARHEAFATSFAPDGSVLRVGARNTIAVAYADLSAAGETVHARTAPLLRRPFNLTQAPLAHIELMHVSARCHALLIVAHHLIFDGWSAAVFLDEVACGYRALASGCEPEWPQAESLREFTLAQRKRSAAASTQLEYWKRVYSTLPEALALPTDRPRPAQAEYAADTVFHDFAPEFTAALRGYARTHGQTAYSVLLAAFGVLLARLSGQSDFAIGIPFAAQAVAGSRCLIGDGVNTLPVRLQVVADETFLALSQRCRQILLDAADNQDITLHALQSALGQKARSGVFNSLVFNLNPRMSSLDWGALEYSLRDGAKTALINDLFFNFNDHENQLTLDVHYRSTLFDAATVRRWIDHLQTLLGTAMADPQATVAALPLLDEAQRTRIIHECDASARNYNLDVALTDLVREQALRMPQRIAIECAGKTVSHAELASRAHALARTLRARGVGQGDVVGICTPRGIEMVVGLLGIMASGAAYLPLDPTHPAERLQLLADDAGVQHVLALTREQIPSALAHARKIHAFDEFAAPPAVELPHVGGAAPAYILYTSGSTGTPKGVRVLHRNLVNCLLSMAEQPGLAATDVLCAITPLTFDIAAVELYLPLLVGAKVLLATDTERRDPDLLLALMHRRSATVLQATPSWLRALAADERPRRLPRMRLLIGGEELPRDLAERVLPHSRELWNLYGPTETTIWSTCCRVTSGVDSVPIGRPIANTHIYVVDQHGQIAPPGVRGEIWICGAGVSDGYLQPGMSEERFIADPFRREGLRVYRTGDIGSWRDGQLYFHGRRDAQFKLRGFRIEPAEIEAAALAVPGVRAAVAALFARSEQDKRLALYVVAPSAAAEFSDQLRDRLRRTLPPHMVPQYIELLNTLPQTAHGKIDRKALPPPQPSPARVESKATEPAPMDNVTRTLLQIWKDLLGTEHVTLDANFFDIGGDSLLGVQLFQRVQTITGVNLPLSTLLTAQTVREQVCAFRDASIRNADPRGAAQHLPGGWSPLVPIQEGGSRPPLFAVHALGGNVLNYVPLARSLGADQPVYGLQAIGLDGIAQPLTTIEEMAARYLPEVRARCPHGPYYLCGGSMGGLIAYELAQMLAAQGEQVAFVGLFDTYGPGCMTTSPSSRLGHWRERWAQLRRLDAVTRRAALVNACARRVERGRDALQHAWCRWRGQALPHDTRYRELERAHWRADFAYRPRAYSGMVNLFRAREQPEPLADMRALGWDTVALGGVHVIDLPGTHETLIEQPELANALRSVLDRAQRSAGVEEIEPSFRLAG
jgi:amino acid adenylation domain-containing protein